jgi:hypothetical protein
MGPPIMMAMGVMESARQGMASVINGISDTMTRADGMRPAAGGDTLDGDNSDSDIAAPSAAPDPVSEGGAAAAAAAGSADGPRQSGGAGESEPIRLQRSNDPEDDYTGGPDAVYATWWPLFPLLRGLDRGKALHRRRIRNLFLYFDNRFAHSLPLIFHLANVTLRHAVNQSVGATVKTSGKAFAKLTETINDPGFRALLEEAKADPNGAAARKVTAIVLRFLNLSGRSIPWSNRERAAEITKQLALHRTAGAAMVFHTLAPGDVHDVLSILNTFPFNGYDNFPATVPADFLTVSMLPPRTLLPPSLPLPL